MTGDPTDATILIVEDDPGLAEGLEYNLEAAGYDVVVARDGDAGLAAVREGRPDLVVLDLMLPKRSGFDVLEALRAAGCDVPVVILSARDGELDKIRGFDLGAVDYVTKPFSVGELLARIRVRLAGAPTPTASSTVGIGDGTLDLDRLRFVRGGDEVPLTPTEVDVLRKLVARLDQPVAREELTRSIWGIGPKASRTLDTHVARLRKKLEVDPAAPAHLLTVHGVGYRLVP